ncbi:MAG: hypothetical protein AABX00_00375 [Nanoarchaeota archaeon]
MSKKLQTIISDELAEKIKNKAKKDGRSVSNLVFQLIQMAVKENEKS